MFRTNKMIFVERIEKGQGNVEFDMTLPYLAESRLREIAFVTIDKAPELLAMFVEAYSRLGDHYAVLEEMVERADNASDKRRAVIVLDEVPDYVKLKGLASTRSPMGSEDIRDAIVNRDQEYQSILDKLASYRATRELVYMKLKSMDQAYTAVKKIIDNQQPRFARSLNGTIPEDATAGDTVEKNEDQVDRVQSKGWGKPKY